jgi:hypothetical protein
MEIIEQLTNLDTVEVSSHGLREKYFEPTAARSSSSTSMVSGHADDEE